MRGPANPSLNDMAGLLVDGFDRRPSVLMPYNPPYYVDFLARYGFERAMTMWAYYNHLKIVNTDKLRRGTEIVKRRNPDLRLRELDMKRFEADARIMREIYNDAWSDNWGHVPVTEAEFAQMTRDMKQIVDPHIVYFLEKGDETVAFVASLPNLNEALVHVRSGRLFPTGLFKLLAYSHFGTNKEIRMPLMGVRRKYHGRGFDALLILETIDRADALGYQACEMSWILDNNHALRNALKSINSVIDKEYALFEKTL